MAFSSVLKFPWYSGAPAPFHPIHTTSIYGADDTKSAGYEDRVAMGDPRTADFRSGESLNGIDSAPRGDYERMREIENHPITMACVRKIAWAAASVKFGLENPQVPGDIIYDHPILTGLTAPHRNGGGRWGLINLIYMSLAMTGRAYLYAVAPAIKTSPPIFHFMRSDRVQPIRDPKTNRIVAYRYNAGASTASGTMTIPAEEVCEIRHHHITDNTELGQVYDSTAYSALTAAWNPVKMHSGLSELTRKLLANNGGLPGILNIRQEAGRPSLSEEQQDGLGEYLKKFRQGGEKFGSIAFMETPGELEFVRITEDFKSFNTESAKTAAVNEICAVYGVPPLILGLGSGATYANQQEARRYFWLDTVIPGYVEVVASALTAFFGLNVVPDLEDVPALSDYRLSVANSLAGMDFITVNEKRAKMGYKPVPFGDRLTQPMGKQPLDTQIVTSDAQTLMTYDQQLLQAIIAQATEESTVKALNMYAAEMKSRTLAQSDKMRLVN